MADKRIILNTSKEAAMFVKNIEGWVDCHGRFWGKDKRMARWSGATHIVCECGQTMTKGWTICKDCREKRDIEKYNNAERKEWDGETPLYSDATGDYYMYGIEEIEDGCAEHGVSIQSLRLYLCEPQLMPTLEAEEIFEDIMPDDDASIPNDVLEAFEVLNGIIKAHNRPISWMPGKYAANLEAIKNNPQRKETP